ncbi:MAG: hypothetical protein LGR52_15795 [Candidatus Thiosymbion ectosymbiont of Robbea hypermnestra]|nr:hypothetical protein [Candidatus Thiosymbion ectosymbiont of Robbea hypermnestra]
MAFNNSNETVLLEVIADIKAACSELPDGSLKTKITSKLEDGEKLVLDNIEREQGMAMLYLMSTKEIATKIVNPFKNFEL